MMMMFKSRLFKRVGFKRNMSNYTTEKVIVGLGGLCFISNCIALHFAVQTSSIICNKK